MIEVRARRSATSNNDKDIHLRFENHGQQATGMRHGVMGVYTEVHESDGREDVWEARPG